MTDTLLYVALFAGVAALVLAVYYARAVLAMPQGNERMIELTTAIREGAMAFMKREYTWVSVFVVAMAVLIGVLLDDGVLRALAYVFGAVLSAGAGFVGMGCVGDVHSSGTSVWGTARSSMGQTGSPVMRSNT